MAVACRRWPRPQLERGQYWRDREEHARKHSSDHISAAMNHAKHHPVLRCLSSSSSLFLLSSIAKLHVRTFAVTVRLQRAQHHGHQQRHSAGQPWQRSPAAHCTPWPAQPPATWRPRPPACSLRHPAINACRTTRRTRNCGDSARRAGAATPLLLLRSCSDGGVPRAAAAAGGSCGHG